VTHVLRPGRELRTWLEVLTERGTGRPSDLAYSFRERSDRITDSLEYAELFARAKAIAAVLQGAASPGTRALLLYPPGLDFVAAFMGCLCAGIVAVPVYPPNPSRLNFTADRLGAIARDAGARLVLTTDALHARRANLAALVPQLASVAWISTDTIAGCSAAGWTEPPIEPTSLALLQYTSGSTAAPRGVMLTHENLLRNQQALIDLLDIPRSLAGQPLVGGSWVPLYHDMGLIGHVLFGLYLGFPMHLMSPWTFARRPIEWLRMLSQERAAISGAPNFAYELCARRVRKKDLERLDLSSWRIALNGAEPIRPETLRSFSQVFEPAGFRPGAFHPCYGLAEATLIVTGTSLDCGSAAVLQIDPDELKNGRARAAAHARDAREIVSCGSQPRNSTLLIVNPDTDEPCEDEEIGEIWIAGPCVAAGYCGSSAGGGGFGYQLRGREESFLRTDDLGFMRAGHLYVTGRRTDLLRLGGRSVYPQDVELTVETAIPEFARLGCGVALSVGLGAAAAILIVQEVQSRNAVGLEAVAQRIRQQVGHTHGAAVGGIVFTRPGEVPKTSSGKLRRSACRQHLLQGQLRTVFEWWRSPVVRRAAVLPRTAEPVTKSPERPHPASIGRDRSTWPG
jgi:acyl-CoA synthetase (AMP-forming)/AMP-acid ligase II